MFPAWAGPERSVPHSSSQAVAAHRHRADARVSLPAYPGTSTPAAHPAAPYQLRPAVRGEARRAECLPRSGRNRGHTARIQRPSRLECNGRSLLPISAVLGFARHVLIYVNLVAVEVFHQDAGAVGTDLGFAFELDAAVFQGPVLAHAVVGFDAEQRRVGGLAAHQRLLLAGFGNIEVDAEL